MTYNPELIERLVREARAVATLLDADTPTCSCTGWYDTPHGEHEMRCAREIHLTAVRRAVYDAKFTAMADQLEAARREIERLMDDNHRLNGVADRERESADRFAALWHCDVETVERQRDAALAIAKNIRSVVEAAERWRDFRPGDSIPEFTESLTYAIDAYRAAKGNRP